MALPLLSRMISWPNSNIHDFSQDQSSLLQVHSTSHYLLFVLSVNILLYTCSYLKTQSLFIYPRAVWSILLQVLSWPHPHGPTFGFYGLILYCQESYHYVSPSVTCRCLSRRQYHCYMSYQDLLCYTSITPHSTISGVAATHIITVYSTLMSISPRGTKENPPISWRLS